MGAVSLDRTPQGGGHWQAAEGEAAQKELNVRAVVGALNVGVGASQLEKLLAAMDIPTLNGDTFADVQRFVLPALEGEGDASQKEALAEERRLAYEAGVTPREDERFDIPVSFDAQWMKPGKAMNAPDGYGSAFGGRTKKCIMTTYRSNMGPLKNHIGSSGAMEPAMGAECVVRLGSEDTGVVVGALCLDLDAKTPKAVREAVEKKGGLPVPTKLHDPNHFVKAVGKRLIGVKAKVKMTNVMPPVTQRRLKEEVALAVHQNRGSLGSKVKMKAAINNVLAHAYNDHSACRSHFRCPCAPNERGVILRSKSTYKDGLWLDEAGGKQGGEKLRGLLETEWKAITPDAHMDALSHDYDTQVCESMNSLHIALHPKRRDMSRSCIGRAIHKLTSARYNNGVLRTVRGVLSRVGITLGRVGEITLAKHDHKREVTAKRKASVEGKGKRKAARKRRVQRDDKSAGELGYGAGVGLVESEEEGEEGEEEGEREPPAARVSCARKCGLCGQPGHNRVTCPQRAM